MAKSLYFEEMSGNKRRVLLAGSEAPLGGIRKEASFQLGGEVRKTEAYDMGVEAPNVHVAGTKENDLVLKLEFRDLLTGRPGNAMQRMAVIDSIRRETRPLRLVWGGVMRRGMLAKAEFDVESESDITSTLTFSIYDHGIIRRKKRSALDRLSLPIPNIIEGLAEQVAKVKKLAVVPNLRFDLASSILELWGQISAPFALLLSLGRDITEGIGETLDALRAVQMQAYAMFLRSKDLLSMLSSLNPNDAMAIDDAKSKADWSRQQADAAVTLQAMITSCREMGESAERKAGGSSTKVVYASAGETLESIGVRVGAGFAKLRALNPGVPIGPLEGGTEVRVP